MHKTSETKDNRLQTTFAQARKMKKTKKTSDRFSIVCGVLATLLVVVCTHVANAEDDNVFIWQGPAPGETSLEIGTVQTPREGEVPPVMRVTKIRRPTLDVFLAKKPSGTAMLILPGGGFTKVVPDKEGSEAAPWLNRLGISVFVLRYRTNEGIPAGEPAWRRPLQDAQRALRLIRTNAKAWRVQTDRVGVLGFSAGGQVASILHTKEEAAAYDAVDDIDRQSCRPDFSLLVYPWRVFDAKTNQLLPEIRLSAKSPPAFLVHTHDDASSSLGSVFIYAGLKQHNVSAELHVYENGGHGYGMRQVSGSDIGSWPDRATDWLVRRQLAHSDN